MSGDQLDLDAIEAQHRAASLSHARLSLPLTADFNIGASLDDVPALVAEVRRLRAKVADAWDEGRQTYWRRGPDNCRCSAWSAGECGCGEYGTGELLSLGQNPYRQ